MNQYKGCLKFSSFENMVVSLYVVGYKNIGESVIVLFRDKALGEEDVVFSFVVDCYKKDNLFLTRDILDTNHVTALDMVFWTHPHKDHTPGIDTIVKDYFKPEMQYFKPKFYFGNLCEDLLRTESEYTAETNNNIETFFATEKNRTKCRRTITGEGDVTNHFPIKMVSEDGASRDLVFYFLTPLGCLIDEYSLKGHVLNKPNDLSISFVMSVDGYDFFFGGDTENEHCEGIEEGIIREMRWIKVPHHCSKGGKFLCDNLGPGFNFAASTVYTSSGLPVEDIQNAYAAQGRLFMTQLLNEDLNHEYGVIRFDYVFHDDSILVNILTYGNAGEYVGTVTNS